MILTNILGILYKQILRPFLFRLDPEKVHNKIISFGALLGRYQTARLLTQSVFNYKNPALTQNILGIEFKNPIGLSAGFDKNADLINILSKVGFGYMQVGTVTNHSYKGNPQPRLYRLPKSKSLVVYYGLKNIGVDEVTKKLEKAKDKDFPLSISIGKTNSPQTSTTREGVLDYYETLRKLNSKNLGAFYTLNISCPNTFGGEPFTTPGSLKLLLGKISRLDTKKPIFLKMPINLKWGDFEKLLKVAVGFEIDGVIIGNLNKNHNDPAVKDKIPNRIKGGLSGKPTWKLSNNLIAKTHRQYGNKLIIVGVGGVFSAQDAYTKIKLGASLVQLITGMIYEGPQLIGQINRGLVKLLKKDGYTHISQAIGANSQNLG